MPEAKSLKKPAVARLPMAPRDPPVTPRGDRSASAASAMQRGQERFSAALRRVDEELGLTRERVPQAMTREQVLEAIGQGIHGPYDPRVVGAVDYLLDRLAELDVDEERFVRSAEGAVADARSRSPRRDHTTTTRPPITRPSRVIIHTSADGQTHTTIIR